MHFRYGFRIDSIQIFKGDRVLYYEAIALGRVKLSLTKSSTSFGFLQHHARADERQCMDGTKSWTAWILVLRHRFFTISEKHLPGFTGITYLLPSVLLHPHPSGSQYPCRVPGKQKSIWSSFSDCFYLCQPGMPLHFTVDLQLRTDELSKREQLNTSKPS